MPSGYPRILVGCPTHEVKRYALAEYLKSVRGMRYPNVDIVIVDNSPTPDYAREIEVHAREWEKEHPGHTFRVIHHPSAHARVRGRIVESRNTIRDIVLNEKYDYFFSLEQDIILPENALEKLLAHQKNVCAGVYVNPVTLGGKRRIMPVVCVHGNEEQRAKGQAVWMNFPFLFPARLTEVACAGLGAMLIHRSVLEKIPFRFDEKHEAFDDVHFCLDVQKMGERVHMDTGLLCGHRYSEEFTDIPPEKY